MTSALLKDIFIPLGSVLFGGLVVLLSAMLTERFRRHGRWEPYAKELWGLQLAVCSDVMTLANKAMNSAIYCHDVFNPNKESQALYAAELQEQLVAMGELKGKRLLLCTANFNQSVEGLFQQLLVISYQFQMGELNQKLAGNLPPLWFSLVDDARKEIRTEPLDDQARAALDNVPPAPKFNPTGNSTLTY